MRSVLRYTATAAAPKGKASRCSQHADPGVVTEVVLILYCARRFTGLNATPSRNVPSGGEGTTTLRPEATLWRLPAKLVPAFAAAGATADEVASDRTFQPQWLIRWRSTRERTTPPKSAKMRPGAGQRLTKVTDAVEGCWVFAAISSAGGHLPRQFQLDC